MKSNGAAVPPIWQRWLVGFVGAVAVAWLCLLAVETALRVAFPWDFHSWSESPFMTNMLKLHLGQHLFGPPADGNSFIYSPGLEYLAFALLRPLGLDLDIRFCRIVTVGVALLAGVAAGSALRRVLVRVAPGNRFPCLVWQGGAVALLVIFKNFHSDVPHPDNLAMLHTAGVFLLTFWAWQEKRFGVAVLAMLLAGWGVFAKQILALAFVGPVLVFAWFNPWGWWKWLVLAAVGVLSTTAALTVLWWSAEARFYTLYLLPRQGLHLTRFYWMLMDLVTADRAFLLMLGLIALPLLWRSGTAGREYVQFWVALGLFGVCPNALSYVKTMGTWNNLIAFQLWLLLLVWPAIAVWLARAASGASAGQNETVLFNYFVATLLVIFVLLLLPPKEPPHRTDDGRVLRDSGPSQGGRQSRTQGDGRAGHDVFAARGGKGSAIGPREFNQRTQGRWP